MGNLLRKILFGTALIGGLAGCGRPQQAVVTGESFSPKHGFFSGDIYRADIKLLNGNIGFIQCTNEAARACYNGLFVGDTVKVSRFIGTDQYQIASDY